MMTAETIAITFFNDFTATTKRQERMTPEDLAERIRTTTAPSKAALPWLKLARFGDLPTEKGSQRWDGNVIDCSGIEADYDAEEVSFEAAVDTAEKAGLLSIIYTSPSHSPERPRWRIVCPTSKELPPTQRAHMVGRVNGLYRGIFAAESWTLSQSYYYGSVNSNPAHQVAVIDGQPVDELDELDEIWIGKPGTKTAGNGAATTQGSVDEDALLEQIRTGANYHTPAMRLLGSWANHDVSLVEAHKRLHAAFNDVFPPDRDARWRTRVGEIPRMLEHIWGKEAQERDAKEADFDAWQQQQPPDAAPRQEHRASAPPSDIVLFDAADILAETIEPRGWLLGTTFCKQFTSSLVGTGGVGKTAVRIVQALAVATGRNLTGEHVHKRAKVLFLCFEDGAAELKRRAQAAMRYHKVTANEVRSWMFFATISGYKILETDVRGNRVPGSLSQWLRDTIKKAGIELVILDPFIKTHGLEENDNAGIDAVCTELAQIGIELDIASDYLHHIRKGTAEPGNADAGRGASAAKDAARLARTCTPMSKDDAELFGVSDADRVALVRVDDGKVNLAPRAADAIWFHLIGVALGNTSITYPSGDNVQTVERWYPPDMWKGLTISVCNQILDRIAKGPEPGLFYSPAPNAGEKRRAWPIVQEFCPNISDKQAKDVIKTWIENGVLKKENRNDEDRKPSPSLIVGKRPGDTWES